MYRVLLFAWQSFWRNFWLSLVTITVIILTFIAINFLIVINFVTDSAINVVQDKIDVSVYFKEKVIEPQVLEVQTYLSSLPQVKEITYISQQNALQQFRERHQQDTTIIRSLEELEENPLGATLTVKAKDLSQYPEIIEILDNSQYNDLILDKNFDDHQQFIERIKVISDNIKKIGYITSIVFVIVSLLIVFNTIRVAIYTHRQEITIMKLVGATNWFIRGPFLMESIMYGLIGATLGLLLFYPTLNIIQPYLSVFFSTENINIVEHFQQNIRYIFGIEVLIILLLTIISSAIAIRRYLRV